MKSIKNRLLISLSIAIFSFFFISILKYFYEIKIEEVVYIVKSDIANDISRGFYLESERKIQLLHKLGFDNLFISHNLNQKIITCSPLNSYELFVDGIAVGRIIDCSNYFDILKYFFNSYYFHVVTVLLISLCLFLIIVPLYNYKRKVLHFLEIMTSQPVEIENHLKNENDPIIKIVKKSINALVEKNKELERQQVFSEIASQVAHDIRSPLAALKVSVHDLNLTPSSKKDVIISAIGRINDIANQLLNSTSQVAPSGPSLIPIIPLLESLISEKKSQYKDFLNVKIEFNFDTASNFYVDIDPVEIGRIFSNLINNSIEALDNKGGIVKIELSQVSNVLEIKIIDNGKGISENHIKMLGEKGFSFGKNNTDSGSGLGIYHAKKYLNSIMGDFVISSQVNKGTEITIRLKLSSVPQWLPQVITLKSGVNLITVDDDISIQQLWKNRLNHFKFNEEDYTHIAFTSLAKFKEWIIDHPGEIFFCLIDHDFTNQPNTGLEIVDELKISNNSILVTSKFDDALVLKNCINLGMQLLPKFLIGSVEIKIQKTTELPSNYYDVIFIDDDELLQIVWRAEAKRKKKKFIGYYSFFDFQKNMDHIDKNSIIYIDSLLSTTEKGEVLSKIAFDYGFKNIYLCTGYDSSKFKDLKHIKGIIGKNPIFKS